MKRVCTAASVRARDEAVIAMLGGGHTLMEIAGRDAAAALSARWPSGPVAVLCGPGNNGGDGYVLARWLALEGREVRLWAPREPATSGGRANAALCERMSLPRCSELAVALAGASTAVDAMLGTGQRDAPRGPLLEGVRALAAAAGGGLAVVALDVPTGVSADTGAALGDVAVAADLTVTFGHWKRGLLCEPGAQLAGEVVLVDIGLELAGVSAAALPGGDAWLLEAPDVAAWMPTEGPGEAKWSRGHVAVRAGGGAAVLAAHGAFRAGAGLVSLLAPREAWPRLSGLWPEVILDTPDALRRGRHDVLVIGPGLGLGEAQRAAVCAHWASWPGAVVADADALTALGPTPPEREAGSGPRVITPHAAEAGRLLGRTRAAVEADRFAAVADLAAWGGAGCVAVLKGPNSLIAGAGTPTVVSPVRCGRLATAGSGDVLAGLVGGLLARGLGPHEAAALGVWWHGHAGLQLPPRGTASDLIGTLRSFSRAQ